MAINTDTTLTKGAAKLVSGHGMSDGISKYYWHLALDASMHGDLAAAEAYRRQAIDGARQISGNA